MHEPIEWRAHWEIIKYRDDLEYERVEIPGNLLTYGGASALWDLLIGAGTVTAFDNTNAHIGAGNGDTTADPAQTDLQGASKARVVMDATYPVHTDGTDVSASTIVFQATFDTSTGNFAWEEIGLFNDDTGGRMLNRKVTTVGTKTGADTWVAILVLTLT